jgi:hypothetical protein
MESIIEYKNDVENEYKNNTENNIQYISNYLCISDVSNMYANIFNYIGNEYQIKLIPYFYYNLQFHENYEFQFSKGLKPLKYWVHLAFDNPPTLWNGDKSNPKYYNISLLNTINNYEKIYYLSSLILTLQLFGDGNHRTACKFFIDNMNREMTNDEIKYMYNILHSENSGNSYYRLIQNPINLKTREPISRLDAFELTIRNVTNHLRTIHNMKLL